MSRYLRKLRIAFSALCGIVCVLLIVLWVRSYWVGDILQGDLSKTFELNSFGGQLLFLGYRDIAGWEYVQRSVTEAREVLRFFPDKPVYGFLFFSGKSFTVLALPHWFPVLIFAALATLSWIPWSKRFSLRTLLIATTLIAVVLGLIVWSKR